MGGWERGQARQPMPARPIRDGERADRLIGGGGVPACLAIRGRRTRGRARLPAGANAGDGATDRI